MDIQADRRIRFLQLVDGASDSIRLTQINPRKLQIAMPLYGYDKVVGTNATHAMSVLAAQNQAISTGSPIEFDQTAMSPWYRHWMTGVEHVVWFEDIRSFIEKYSLIDIYQLSGTTFWQISLPAPQNWAYLSNYGCERLAKESEMRKDEFWFAEKFKTYVLLCLY